MKATCRRLSAAFTIQSARNFVLYVMGVGLTLNEFLSRSDDRQWHIVLCAALLGLPFVLTRDERRDD
jgi:hypothetical protein